MVTRVEVGSIASLRAGPGLGDISREEALKRSYFCQTGEVPGAPSTRLLRTKSPLQTHLFPLPIAPKPFLKDQVLQKKAPVTSSWPGASQSCPSAETDKKEAKEDVAKRMPSLAGQEADSGETLQNGPSAPNKATFLRSGPSTMGLFEATKAGSSLGKGTSEGDREAGSRAAQVSSPLSARPEVAAKPAISARKPSVTLPRPTSLSQDSGSTVSQEEAGQAQPLPKAHRVEDPAGQAPEVKPRPKRRPMSAVFRDYLQPPKPGPGGAAALGKVPPVPPEKTWVRKPRPLSMDLTAVFESREVLLRKAASEQSPAEAQGPERTSVEPRGDAEGPACVDATPQDPDSDFQEVAKRVHARREKALLKRTDADSPRTPRARAIPGDDQSPQVEGKPEQQSQKALESPLPRPGRGLGLAQVKGGVSDQEAPTGMGRKCAGSVRKRLSLFEEGRTAASAVVSEPSRVAPESPSTAAEPERAGVKVQARVKGWTVESTGAKPEVRRRASQGRPLPADLTKLFSRSPSSTEVGYQKDAVLGDELSGERAEKPKEGHGLDEAAATKSPWRSVVPQTSRQTEPKDASAPEGPDRCGRARSAGDPGPSEASPEDDGSFQKVWATVFEHHVERHTVVDQAGRRLSPTPPHDVADVPDPKPGLEKGYWLGKDPPAVTNKRDSFRWSDHDAPGVLGRAVLVDVEPSTSVTEACPVGEGHSGHSVLRRLESPPVSQRIQPKYDIVHASGERAHSEAVSRVPEEKAVTLRSGRPRLSLSGRQLPREASCAHLEYAGQAHGGAVQRASSMWEARGPGPGGPKPDCPQPRGGFGGGCPSSKWTGEGAVASWHSTSVVSQDLSAPQRGPSWDGSANPPSRATIEPGESLGRERPDSSTLPKSPLEVACEDNPRLAQAVPPEVRMRRSSPSEPRMDRWRRRTLPHDVKFDTFSLLTPENTSRRQQRPADDATSPACASQRSPLSRHQAQTEEEASGAWQTRTLPVEKPGPSAEPSATFFAVTYQIPDIQKAKSVVKPGPGSVSEPSRRAAPPLPPRSLVTTVVSPGLEEPWAPASSTGRAKGREYEEVKGLPKSPKATDQPSAAGGRTLGPPGDRVIDVDALGTRGSDDGTARDSGVRGSSGVDAPQTSPVLRRPKSLLLRRRTEVISETFPGKMRDGYRSGVLDIDALMAEYKQQSSRVPSKVPEQRDSPTVEPSGSPQERSGWPKEAGWRQRSLKEASWSDSVGRRAGASVKTPKSPGPSQQPAEPPGTAMATKSGLPLWAPPQPASAENCSPPSPVPAASRRKSSGITEFESKPSPSGHQEAKSKQGPAKSQELGREDRLCPRSPPSDRKKGTPKRCAGQGVEGSGAQRGNPPRDCIASPLDIKRACSEKGPPARVQEGLSIMQDARQRRQEPPRGKPAVPAETPKATSGPCRKEARKSDGSKGPLQNPEQGEALRDGRQCLGQVPPFAAVPRRSLSFCKDKRSGPFVNQLRQCFSRRTGEAKDTDTLVHEADSQYGTWADQHQNGGSLGPESPSSPDSSAAGQQAPSSHLSSCTESTCVEHDSSRDRRSSSVDRSSSELESTEGPEGSPPPDAGPAEREDDFSFIHQTSVLDSSALKTRVQLSKRSRRRAPISHSLRRSQFSECDSWSPLEEESHSTWMFKDSTEEKSPRREESDEEPPKVERTPVSHPQRMPMFPGMDPAVLKAQLHKRPEVDSPDESLSFAPQPKTPKSPFQPGVLGSRVLPSSIDKDERSEEPSPQWLKELKSRKRQSLYDNQA